MLDWGAGALVFLLIKLVQLLVDRHCQPPHHHLLGPAANAVVAPPTAAAAPTRAEPLAMLEPLTILCIVSGITLTSASMTIEQPTRMQSEAAVTSWKVAAQLVMRPFPMLTSS